MSAQDKLDTLRALRDIARSVESRDEAAVAGEIRLCMVEIRKLWNIREAL